VPRKVAVLALVLASPLASAGAPYIGLSLGTVTYSQDATEVSPPIDDSAAAAGLHLGYQFNEHLALEGGLRKTAQLAALNIVRSGTRQSVEGEYQAASLMLIGSIPLERVRLFGGIGAYSSEFEGDLTVTVPGLGSTSIAVSEDPDESAFLAAGAEWRFGRMRLRVSLERFEGRRGSDFESLSVGFSAVGKDSRPRRVER
jgi:hypothetical protein